MSFRDRTRRPVRWFWFWLAVYVVSSFAEVAVHGPTIKAVALVGVCGIGWAASTVMAEAYNTLCRLDEENR